MRRQRASGRRRSAPSPVQGASTSTRSYAAGSSWPASRPSPTRTSGTGLPWPRAARCTAARVPRTRSARCSLISLATSCAPRCTASAANSPALPPGPAQRSSHRSAGTGATGAAASARAMSCEPSSCTAARPSRTAGSDPGSPPGRTAAVGAQRPGSAPAASNSPTSASPGRATSATRGEVLSAANRCLSCSWTDCRSAAACPSNAASNALTIHSGWDSRTANASWLGWAAPSAAGATTSSHCARLRSPTRRSTALTKPAAPAPLTWRARPTVSATAAWAGTRIASTWCAPRRRVSSTAASIAVSGRSAATAMIGSYRPRSRIAP